MAVWYFFQRAPEQARLLPISRESMLEAVLIGKYPPDNSKIRAESVAEIIEEALYEQIGRIRPVLDPIRERMVDLIERRFGRISGTVEVFVFPFDLKTITGSHHAFGDRHAVMIAPWHRRAETTVAILGHELAHAASSENEYIGLATKNEKRIDEAIISFFWPGIDAGSLGLSPFNLENIREYYYRLYRDPKVTKLVEKVIDALVEYARTEPEETVWEWIVKRDVVGVTRR